jgi:hypothetical protein
MQDRYTIIGITPTGERMEVCGADNIIQAEYLARRFQLTLTALRGVEIQDNATK